MKLWKKIFLELFLFGLGNVVLADYCCNNNDNTCGWSNIATYEWAWTKDGLPNPDPPDFAGYDGEAMFFQVASMNGGQPLAEYSSPVQLVSDGDEISISFYIHQVVYDGKPRPALYFDDNYGRSTMLQTTYTPGWTTYAPATCGTNAVQCCVQYPCYGKFRITGQILNVKEVLGFDSFMINQCPITTTTTTTSTTTTPTTTTPATTTTTPTTTTTGLTTPKPTTSTTTTTPTTTTTELTTTTPTTTTTTTPTTTTERTTPKPTTEAPTTEAPTPEPTTEAPTTEAPTPKPTTEAPTPKPTTEAPTTEAPTAKPTTVAPTTEAPTPKHTTEAPTPNPTTEAPTDKPTTEAPTTPAATTTTIAPVPPPKFCCTFETGVCDWQLSGWIWSHDQTPDWNKDWVTVTPFNFSGEYVWTQNVDAAKLISPQINNVQLNTNISFVYYSYTEKRDVTNSIYVYFKSAATNTIKILTILPQSNDAWLPVNLVCSQNTPCCDSYPCNGQLVIESSVSSGNTLYAIDNIQTNSECTDSGPCCKFEDSDLCHGANINSETWVWSGTTNPDTSYLPNFTSDGDYIWYQHTATDDTTSAIKATFRTEQITVTQNSIFDLSLFIDNAGSNPLTVSFVREDKTTILDYYVGATTSWESVQLKCQSFHGSCCTQTSCTGYLEVSATVNSLASGQTVFYAIDDLSVDDQCPPA